MLDAYNPGRRLFVSARALEYGPDFRVYVTIVAPRHAYSRKNGGTLPESTGAFEPDTITAGALSILLAVILGRAVQSIQRVTREVAKRTTNPCSIVMRK
jgi:hypothetical protein